MWKKLLPPSLRQALRQAYYKIRKLYQPQTTPPTAIQIVKANTQEAFDYFFQQEGYIQHQYLNDVRMAFFDEVGQQIQTAIQQRYPAGTHLRIADIGCGTGHLLKILHDGLAADYTLEIVGTDFAESALKIARDLLPQAKFLQDDIYASQLEAGSFDIVLCTEVLEHLENAETALIKLIELCQPRGALFLTVPNGEFDDWDGHVNFWTLAEFKAFVGSHADVQDGKHISNDDALWVYATPQG